MAELKELLITFPFRGYRVKFQTRKIVGFFQVLLSPAFMSPLLIILISWYVSRGIAYYKIFNLLVYGCLFLLLLVFILREKVIYPIVALSFLSGYIIHVFGLPAQFIYLNRVLILFFVANTLMQVIIQNQIKIASPILVLWILYMLFSVPLNSSINVITLQSVTAYLLYPLLFIGVINARISEKTEKGILTLILLFVAIQIPFTAIQKFVYYYVSADRVGGTLGRAGTTYMAVLVSGTWSFVFAYLIVYRKKGIKAFFLLVFPLLPIIVGEVKAGFLLATGAGVVVYFVYMSLAEARLRDIGWVFCVILPIGLGYIAYKYFTIIINPDPRIGEYVLGLFSSWDNIIGYLSGFHKGSGSAHRLEVIYFANTYLSGIFEKLFGVGIGTVSSSALLGIDTFRVKELTYILGWITSFGKYYMEIGIIGIGLFLWALISLAIKAAKLLKHSSDRYWKTGSLGFLGGTAVFIAGSIYTSPWRHAAIASSFWICAALLIRNYQRYQHMESADKTSF